MVGTAESVLVREVSVIEKFQCSLIPLLVLCCIVHCTGVMDININPRAHIKLNEAKRLI